MTQNLEVLTVTLNPAVDETIFLDRLVPGTVHRAREVRRQAGGKGVNVAAMLVDAGRAVAATGFLGRDNAHLFEAFFRSRGIHDRFLRLEGETRTGIKIVDRASAETTDLNLPGLAPDAADLAGLEAAIGEAARPGLWLVVSGSLPPGVEPAYLAGLVAAARARGALVAVDASGPALASAVEAGVDLVKPNKAELGELVGRDLGTFADALEAAAGLHERVAHVAVSLGHEGALFLAPELGVMASAPPVTVVSTVGAGDALLAGYLAALLAGKSPADRAREATVFAWSALESLDRRLAGAEERARRAAQISVQPLPQREAPQRGGNR
jgi:1-phosphofructokinase